MHPSVVFLGFAFCLLFTAWSTTQSLLSTVLSESAFLALSLLYLSFAISCFLAPFVISRLGIRWSFIISSFGYVLFIFSIQFLPKVGVVLISIYLGACASLLWVSQGSYLSSLAMGSPDSIGTLTGTFFSIHFLSGISGHALAFLVMQVTTNQQAILICFGFVAAISFVMFWFLPKIENESFVTLNLEELHELWNMKWLIVFIVYEGISVTFQSGVFTKLLQLQLIPKVMFCYGLTLLGGSYIWGKLYDRFGWKSLLYMNLFIHPASYYIFYLQIEVGYYFTAVLLGASDGISVNLINSMISRHFLKNPSFAFAVFKSGQSIASSVGFVLCAYLSPAILQSTIMILLVIGSAILHMNTLDHEEPLIVEEKEI